MPAQDILNQLVNRRIRYLQAIQAHQPEVMEAVRRVIATAPQLHREAVQLLQEATHQAVHLLHQEAIAQAVRLLHQEVPVQVAQAVIQHHQGVIALEALPPPQVLVPREVIQVAVQEEALVVVAAVQEVHRVADTDVKRVG